jgi:hypothetical protein
LINSIHFSSTSTPTKTVLLGVDGISSSNIPLIFVQEPTVIGADELAIPMDTLPPLDQVLYFFFFLHKSIEIYCFSNYQLKHLWLW